MCAPLPKLAQKPTHRLLEEKLLTFLQRCKNLKQIFQIQTQIITNGFEQNEYVAAKIVATCTKSNKVGYARKLFDRILHPNVFLWTAMLQGYAENEFYRETLSLFNQMMNRGVSPNCFTFPFVLKSCGKLSALREGEEVHCYVIKNGFEANPFVCSTLIDMYSRGRAIESAYNVFLYMSDKNIVAWTAIIYGFILSGDIKSARKMFDMTLERDVILWNTMISGYSEIGDMAEAWRIFEKLPNPDVISWNTLLFGYANNRDIEAAARLFEEIPERNVFSWNGLIGGYACVGQFSDSLDAFKRMLSESDVDPNVATLVTVLSACGRLGALDLGRWVHVYADINGFGGSVFVGNGLIDMYSKCGSIENAIDVFNCMNSRDVVTWNAMIGGLAMHGRGSDALNFFARMKNSGEKPNGITFVGVLCACTHMGLVEVGFLHFQSMTYDYSIVPQIEHYGCMVDLISRAGLLNQAFDFVRKMPIKADGAIWSALLGACRIYRNVELAELALKRLIELEPKNPANYIMLSNIYGDVGMWDDVAKLKVMMREIGVKKLPGCSFVEVNDSVAEFYSLDKDHPQRAEIYDILKGLTKQIISSGYGPDIDELSEQT